MQAAATSLLVLALASVGTVGYRVEAEVVKHCWSCIQRREAVFQSLLA